MNALKKTLWVTWKIVAALLIAVWYIAKWTVIAALVFLAVVKFHELTHKPEPYKPRLNYD